MTGKRFIVIDDGLDFMVRDVVTGDDLIDADGVADVLNNYEKENEQLKQREETLLCEIADFQELLAKNDYVCHKRVIDLRTNQKNVTRNKGEHFTMTEGSIYQENKTIINIRAPNNRSTKYMKTN